MRTLPAVSPAVPSGPLVSPSRFFRGWNRFWFSPADPTTLGLIRLCAGLATFYVILLYTFDLQELLGKDAWINLETVTKLRLDAPVVIPPTDWMPPSPPPEPATPEEKQAIEAYRREWESDPRANYAKGNVVCSIWYHVTDPGWMLAIHIGILAVIFLFAIGFCTRVTAVLTWLGVLSYIQRAPTTLFGMDTMMNIALVYLMIGPSGAALSVDRLIERWWARRQARREGRPPPPDLPPEPLVSANFALRLMQIHFCIIYLAAGLSKLQGSMWWNGTAVWGTMANPSFNPLDVALYREFLIFLSKHRWLWEIVIGGGTVFTLVIEISLPFLIWNPRLRWLMISGAVMLHTGIALVMGLVGFGLFMLCLLLSFMPSAVVRRLLNDLAALVRPRLEARNLTTAERLAVGH